MMSKTKTLIAVAVLTLGAVACDRSDRAATTNTTSAESPPPNDPSTLTPIPMDQGLDAKDASVTSAPIVPITPARAPSMGPSQQQQDISGVNNRGSMTNSGTPMNGETTAPASTLNTPPGHIMFPPEKGPGTGQPNSNGSHNIGETGPVDRR
jgi:hypothetical protein